MQSLDHELRPPKGKTGLIEIPKINMQGKGINQAEPCQKRYAIFSHLTNGQVPPAWVELPGAPSQSMLSWIVTYQKTSYRMDLFGGSVIKPKPKNLKTIFQKNQESERKAGMCLFAIPYCDTVKNTDFARLITTEKVFVTVSGCCSQPHQTSQEPDPRTTSLQADFG